ncbi:DUF262 domain-containing protein [Pantoea rwandensis]|uniref:DUF262 domain-containing protein n=1 Tax=Pantoea rwandensis TaxID=1076550 RepID=A0A1X1CVV3_9GAMM|nr:DUF262 domain-containing protein [Pantoea rwandensis]ORM68451.1 hypothetical protein HA51_14930 [Pantoea rwandensis]
MNIIPESKSLEKILSGLETQYCVPDYQRDYAWTISEVETLWLDIITSYKQSSEYFMGTVVLKKDSNSSDIFDIVDGQQRLATFSILFSVIASLGEAFPNSPEVFNKALRDKKNQALARKISGISRARLREPSEPDNYFLRLNRKDDDLFQQIITDEEQENICFTENKQRIVKSDKRLIKTKKIFSKCILEEFTDEDALQQLNDVLVHIVKKLKFITIEVETDYDAFLLFESLNSKGMDLSVSDLVKNKILMRAGGDTKKSEKLLTNWDEMIGDVESSRLSSVDFLRVYWEAIQGQNITKKELYKNVGRYIDNVDNDILDFSGNLKDLASKLSIYASSELTFPGCLHTKQKYLTYCGEINSLKYTTCYPLIMFANEKRQDLIVPLCKLSLSFLFRWITVCDYSVGGAKKIFDEVLLRMRKDCDDETILAPFASQAEKVGDNAFKQAIMQFKTQDNQIAKYILSKCYLHINNSQSIPNYSEIHLEHVLPQDTTKWEQDPNIIIPKGTTIKDYVYNLGNMTLLQRQINQKIKNSIFSTKQDEYSNSIFPTTAEIYNSGNKGRYWSPDWISERCEDIAEMSPKIWPLEA